MILRPAGIPEVVAIEPVVHGDARGQFFERFHRRRLEASLIRVVRGTVFDVAVDLRTGAPTLGRWIGRELSAKDAGGGWSADAARLDAKELAP